LDQLNQAIALFTQKPHIGRTVDHLTITNHLEIDIYTATLHRMHFIESGIRFRQVDTEDGSPFDFPYTQVQISAHNQNILIREIWAQERIRITGEAIGNFMFPLPDIPAGRRYPMLALDVIKD
jgi:hypothetical protein